MRPLRRCWGVRWWGNGANGGPGDWGAATFITLAVCLGVAPAACSRWVAAAPPAASVGSVTGIVAAAGGLGGYFPPLVMGATYDPVDNDYTVGLLLLVATALVACTYTALHAREPVSEEASR